MGTLCCHRRRAGTAFPASLVLAAVLVVLAPLAGCGQNGETAGRTGSGSTAVTPSSSTPAVADARAHRPGATDLVIVYEDGSGKKAAGS